MPNTKPFDEFSDAYDEWFVENAGLYEAEIETIRQVLPSPESEGMEVGVGSGKFAVPLGIKIGVEPSENMAHKARNKGVEVLPGVAENLPFPDNKFGYVLMVTTICFVDDIAKSFQEAHRVLKPGGHIIVAFVDKKSELGQQYESNKEQNEFYKFATFFSSQEVLALLEKAGFQVVKTRQALIPGESTKTILDGYGQGAFVVIKGAAA